MEDYKKKYEEALEKAKDLLHIKNTTNYGLDIDLLNSIFPELKESELKESKDETIRKRLIDFFEDWHENRSHCWGIAVTSILAWLEKQGQTFTKKDVDDAYLKGVFDTKQGKHDARYKYLEEIIAADDIYQMAMNDAMVNEAKEKAAKAFSELCIGKLLGFEKQGEQKPVDSPISKDEILYQLVLNGTITEFDYLYLTRRFNITEPTKDYQDIDPHFGIPANKVKSNLLTVERAKEISPFMRSGLENESADKVEPKFKVGDMVCKKKDNSFCATINSITDTVYLCDVFDSDGDYDDDYAFLISEQDEYELVAKKIEDEIEIPFGAKDSELQEATYYIPKGFHAEIDDDKVVIKKGEKPAAWSDDEERIKNTLSVLDVQVCWDGATGKKGNPYQKEIDWLKSIKVRIIWKPSKKQMETLEYYMHTLLATEHKEVLFGLYNDLKKL